MSFNPGACREPGEIFDRYGADALRWYFFANQPPWTSIRYSEQSIKDCIPEFLLRLWNVYSFFVIYANIDGFDPAARLGIYRNNVVTRLTQSLSAAYPVVSQLVDPSFFAYAAGEFIGRHLPESGCLSNYGVTFPAFLAEFPPAAELKYLPDVANLEWAIHDIRCATASSPSP